MTTKKTIKKALDETSKSPLKIARKEDGETRAVAESNAAGAADSLDTSIRTVAPAIPENPVPNVRAEDNPASTAPEDVREASVAEPNP